MSTEQLEDAVVSESSETDVESDGADDGNGAGADASTVSGSTRPDLVKLVLLAVAVVLAVSGSAAWWQAAHDDQLDAARARDALVVQANRDIATMNTLDYRSVADGVKAWAAVTTGTLRDQLAGVSAEDRKLLADQKKISTGRVINSAVTDLDDDTATVIAAVEVTVRDGEKPDATPTVKRNRYSADLVRVGGQWKLESLQQVAVDLS